MAICSKVHTTVFQDGIVIYIVFQGKPVKIVSRIYLNPLCKLNCIPHAVQLWNVGVSSFFLFALCNCASGAAVLVSDVFSSLTRWRWVLLRRIEGERSLDSDHLVKLPGDGKILLRELYLNNWAALALKLQAHRDSKCKVRGYLTKIFTSLFNSGYIRTQDSFKNDQHCYFPFCSAGVCSCGPPKEKVDLNNEEGRTYVHLTPCPITLSWMTSWIS